MMNLPLIPCRLLLPASGAKAAGRNADAPSPRSSPGEGVCAANRRGGFAGLRPMQPLLCRRSEPLQRDVEAGKREESTSGNFSDAGPFRPQKTEGVFPPRNGHFHARFMFDGRVSSGGVYRGGLRPSAWRFWQTCCARFLLFRSFRPAWFRSALWRRSERKPVRVIRHRAGKPGCNSPRAAMSRSITTAAAAAFSSIPTLARSSPSSRARSAAARCAARCASRSVIISTIPRTWRGCAATGSMNSTARRRRSTIIPPTPSSFQRRPASQDIPAMASPPHRTTVTVNRCRRKQQRASPSRASRSNAPRSIRARPIPEPA